MRKLLTVLFLLGIPLLFSGQNDIPVATVPLSPGYKNILLGQSMDEVKSILKKSADFKVRREEILTIRLEPDTEIINTEGRGFIEKGYFHFHADKLYQILLKIDEKKIGYFVLLKQLTDKYGTPLIFTPLYAEWSDEQTTITLEKPCTLKYRQKQVWEELTAGDTTTDSLAEKTRLEFLQDL